MYMRVRDWLSGTTRAQVTTAGIRKGSTQDWLPFADVQAGIVVMKDGGYIKIMEILPTNFYLKSQMEQEGMIQGFYQYLKISPNNIQIRVVTQKADIAAYEARMSDYFDRERNANCREMILDNIEMARYLAVNEAVTHRFFMVIQLEPGDKPRSGDMRDIAAFLDNQAQTARGYLDQCGLEVVEWDDPDAAVMQLLFGLLNKKSARNIKISEQFRDMLTDRQESNMTGGE
jgi:hypothetical protein